MDICPNNQQFNAIQAGVEWYKKASKQLFVIAGYAGTGKTTLVRWILDACGISIEEGIYVAYVGKAAMVLGMKGLPAKTIHSTIYDCIEVPKMHNGQFVRVDDKIVYTKTFELKSQLPPNIKIIIVDEGSMVDDKLMKDLMSFGIPIIVLGDLHQLPPVFGKSKCLENPDIVLTEIMRQAEDNPIIHFATMAREQRWNAFKFGNYGNKVFIGRKEEIMKSHKLIKNSNVIICAFNRTRAELNDYIRTEVYNMPKNNIAIGEKLICRENDWSRAVDENTYLINGMIGYLEDYNPESFDGNSLDITFRPEFHERMFYDVPMDWKYLNMDYEKRRQWISQYNKFEFGYAITCHLSQGSQYDNVLIFNEDMRRGRDNYSKWLYTAITRAVKRLVIAL